MQLTPRYGTDPIITLDGSASEILAPIVRQRRRLAARLGSFTDEQWAQQSRCEGWSNRDVIVHLDSTNSFWTYSIASGRKGAPTQFLATFDPVVSPAQLVAAANDIPPKDVLDKFAASTESLVDLLTSLDDDDWSALAEAPPGHLSISAVCHHALWDSWVHERDILLPLGIAPDEEPDEIAACLRYVAALAPAFAISRGGAGRGTIAIEVTEPALSVVVEIGERVAVRAGTAGTDARLTGEAVPLVEALSVRAPLTHSIPPGSTWMVEGLAAVFDVEQR
jgi:uncharacterized protein (TIGR03083 family)